MSYTYVSSIGVRNIQHSRWENNDVSNVLVSDLFSNYRKLYLILNEPLNTVNVYVDLHSLLVSYSNFIGTLNDLLIHNGFNTLPTINSIPTLNTKYALYSDAFMAGYDIQTIGRNTNYNSKLPKHLKTDLMITRPGTNTDMGDVYDHCLFSVNGFFHLSDTDRQKVYIFDGGKSCYRSRQNNVGIISFKNIAKLKFIPIKEEMIFGSKDDSDIYTRAYINTGLDISNKYIFIVLGGYLIKMDKDILFKVSEKNICVNVSRLNLLNRYYESLNIIDYSSLELHTSSNNSNQISIEQFLSPRVIRKYLTLSQSFIVVVDKEDLFFNKYQVKERKIAGFFETFSEPKYPLFLGNDRIAEYWWNKEDKLYTLTANNYWYQNKVFESVVGKSDMNINANNLPYRQTRTSNPYFLEIGSDI